MSENPTTNAEFQRELLTGLQQPKKQIACKYFYDQRGCELFEQICDLDEYYLTRTELNIMNRHASEMANSIGPNAVIIEFGSGAGTKTRILLDHLQRPSAYVPVDIADEHLAESRRALSTQLPHLRVVSVCADFTHPFALPESVSNAPRKIIYFPGSTIGNFEQFEMEKLLRSISDQCKPSGGLLLGIDLKKDSAILEAAYDDARGVTAEFNLNLLHRANREAEANFAVEQFRHVATYNKVDGRIEMYLESLVDQQVQVAGQTISFRRGERIFTEYSHKYDVANLADVARDCDLELKNTWTDDREFFAVLFFESSL